MYQQTSKNTYSATISGRWSFLVELNSLHMQNCTFVREFKNKRWIEIRL